MVETLLAEEEGAFRAYADACIDEWAAHGKTTQPMHLYLSKKPTIETLR